MADVFISYANEDRVFAEKIATGLLGAGFTVWWDRHIHAGVRFNAEIKRQIEAARVVIVLWSVASHEADWVLDEATFARDENKLIPARIDAIQPPLGFRQLQSLDLRAWSGEPTESAFAALLEALRRFLGGVSERPQIEAPAAPKKRASGWHRYRWLGIGVAAVAVGAVAIVLLQPRPGARSSADTNDGRIAVTAFEPVTKTNELQRAAQGVTDTIVRVLTTNDVKAVLSDPVGRQAGTPAGAAAEFTLRGTVDRDGDKFVVAADLVHLREGVVLWSATMQRDAVQMQVLKGEFAGLVASTMRCALRLRRDARSDPSIDLFGKFLGICAAFVDGRLEQTPELARRIVEVAPQYAAAYALRATASALVSTFGTRKPADEVARLRSTVYSDARKAEQIDPTIDSYFARAIVSDPSVGLAERERLLQRSLEVSPDGPARNQLAQLVRGTGRTREALDNFERAVSANPLDWTSALLSAHMAAWTGNMELARKRFDDLRAQHADPGIDFVQFWAELQSGDPAIAKRIGEDPRVFFWDGSSKKTVVLDTCNRAFIDARMRKVRLSEAELDVACPDGADAGSYGAASFYGYFGYVDAVFRRWEAELDPTSASVAGYFDFLFLPAFRLVRADPRFMKFAARLGLVDYWLDTDQWPDFCKEETLPYDCKEAALVARASEGPRD